MTDKIKIIKKYIMENVIEFGLIQQIKNTIINEELQKIQKNMILSRKLIDIIHSNFFTKNIKIIYIL